VPAVAIEDAGDTSRELGRGPRGGDRDRPVDGLRQDVVGGLESRTHPAPLIDAAQRVRRLGQGHRDAEEAGPEPAEGQEDAPLHASERGVGKGRATGRDLDLQVPVVGM
jgi:hypothetical protein